MAEPPSTITTVNGRRCTRVRRTSTLLAGNTSTSPATSTAAAPGTQTTAAPATTVPPLSSTEAASPVPAPAAPSSSAPAQPDTSQTLASGPATSAPAQSSLVSAGPSQPSSSSSPSTNFAVATTATGPVAFISDSSSSLASSAALNALPSSTIPATTTAQSGSSDTLTAVVSVVSSSTFLVSQPTITSDSTASDLAGGSKGSGSTSDDGHSSGHHSHHGLSPGAIAGIAIGVLFSIVAIVALIVFCLKRRKERTGGLNEKSAGEGGLAGTQARPRSGFAAKWAALTAGIASMAGLKPSNTDGVARRTPESPAFEPVSRTSYSSAGSTRHLRSTSAPANPPANRFAAFKQKFQKPRKPVAERRGRAVSTDSIPSFYSPTPPQLEDLPESLDPFRDPIPLSYHVTNPDAPSLSPKVQTPRSVMPGRNLDEQPGLLTPGLANWRQPTPQFDFPADRQPANPFLDPSKRDSVARRSSLPVPPPARVAAHARTQSGNAKALSQARSSWYSEDSGYVSPHHPSAHVLPLRPPRSDPFADDYELAVDAPSEKDSASIYILPSSRQTSVDSGRSPPGPIPLPSARTSIYRSPWLSPRDSPATSYNNLSGRSSGASGDESRRRTAASRETRGKSDPFDLDRPEVLAMTSTYDVGKTPDLSRHSNGSDWWKEIIDEGTGSGSDFDHPSHRAHAYGLAR